MHVNLPTATKLRGFHGTLLLLGTFSSFCFFGQLHDYLTRLFGGMDEILPPCLHEIISELGDAWI